MSKVCGPWFAITTLFAGLAVAAPLPMSVTMTVSPTHALPGVPPTITLYVTNTSSAAIRMPGVALEVTPDGGESFIASWAGGMINEWAPYQEGLLDVAPGDTNAVVFAASLDSPQWFCDKRLVDPGAYTLRLYLSPDFSAEPRSTDAPVSEVIGNVSFAVSNSAAFTIVQPQGVDAEAWNLKLSMIGPGCGWPDIVAQRIWETYPDSHYAAYNPPSYPGESKSQSATRMQQAIDKDPNGFMADRLRLLLAHYHDGLSARAMMGIPRDVAKAIAENDARVALLQELSQSSNAEIRFTADYEAMRASTRESIMALDAEMTALEQPPAPLQPVVPIAECVTRHRINRKPVQARFGYNNPNASSVTLPFGEKNAFTPDPQDQGQPTTFLPAEHPSAFTITAPKGTYLPSELMWNLDGERAGLPAAAPACTP